MSFALKWLRSFRQEFWRRAEYPVGYGPRMRAEWRTWSAAPDCFSRQVLERVARWECPEASSSNSWHASYKVTLDSVAVVLDADDHVPPVQRHAALRQRLRTVPRPANWPVVGGEVAPGPPRCGIFVLPDNEQPGSLEDLLLEASHQSYPGLHQRSEAFIATIDGDIGALGLIPRDLKDLRKPSGARKATLACVANVLRPGKAIQVAIQDGRWLDAAAIAALPRIQSVQAFVQTLLGLASTATPGGPSPGS